MRFSGPGAGDLAQIWTYTHDRWGRAQADLYSAKLRSTAHSLLRSQRPGRPAGFSGSIRRVKAEHHFIYFRLEGDGILILRILHERMDAPRHFQDLA